MPHLLLFLKGRELFNNPSVSQAANRLSTINGKAARSQTNLGTDERFRFIRLQRYTSSHLGALSTLLEIFKMHSSWCEEVSENIQSTHSTKRSAWKSCEGKLDWNITACLFLFTKTKASSKTETFLKMIEMLWQIRFHLSCKIQQMVVASGSPILYLIKLVLSAMA